jgi:hypothetical protein
MPRIASASPRIDLVSTVSLGSDSAKSGPVLGTSPGGPHDLGPRVGGGTPGNPVPTVPGGQSSGGTAEDPGDGVGALLRRADLLTHFVPFGGDSLELAIDRFLDRFNDLGGELSSQLRGGTTTLFGEMLAVSVALLASELVLGMLDRSPDDPAKLAGAAGSDDFATAFSPFDPWSPHER